MTDSGVGRIPTVQIKFPLIEQMRHRKRRRAIKAPAPIPPPPPPPPQQVTIVSVTAVEGMPNAVHFQFSVAATCDGGECPAVVLDLFGIVDSPRSSEQIAPAAVRFFYARRPRRAGRADRAGRISDYFESDASNQTRGERSD
jgi:hypothetical protein